MTTEFEGNGHLTIGELVVGETYTVQGKVNVIIVDSWGASPPILTGGICKLGDQSVVEVVGELCPVESLVSVPCRGAGRVVRHKGRKVFLVNVDGSGYLASVFGKPVFKENNGNVQISN